jgi:hypothetical protein
MTVLKAHWMVWGITLCVGSAAWATDITGVQYASFDMPQTTVLFRNSATGDPILYGNETDGYGYGVQGFLDTGTSAMLLIQEDAQALGFTPITYNSQPVTFYDIGIGGSEDFSVSAPHYVSVAPFHTENDINLFGSIPPVSAYTQTFGPISTEIYNVPSDPDLGPFDIFGTPIMQNKVVVMDPRPANQLGVTSTYIYDPGTQYHSSTADTDPGIPNVDHHVQLTHASFARFTVVDPSGAPGPTLADNPFIGPNPVSKIDDTVPPGSAPPVAISWGGKDTDGSFLFDSGAQESFISTELAGKLGVQYAANSYNSENPVLVDDEGNPLPNQFSGALGGIGGQLNVAGFYLDSLILQTEEGDPIRYLGAPVLVADVSLLDGITGKTITLDGDFGLNFWLPSFGDVTASASPFSWVTYDQPNGLLGFQFNPDAMPEPSSALLLAVPLMYALGCRRRRAL